jgi:hypothetical protein
MDFSSPTTKSTLRTPIRTRASRYLPAVFVTVAIGLAAYWWWTDRDERRLNSVTANMTRTEVENLLGKPKDSKQADLFFCDPLPAAGKGQTRQLLIYRRPWTGRQALYVYLDDASVVTCTARVMEMTKVER